VIGIVASIAGVVALLSILIAVYFFLHRRQCRRTHGATQQKGIEGRSGFSKPGVSPPPDLQSAKSSGNTINVINKPTPYPMEKYTSAPTSPYFVQSTLNYTFDRHQQMQSVNAATADLDQILHASFFTPNDDTKAWSPTLSPSTPHSRGVQNPEPSFRQAMVPVSPLSFTSNLRDSIIPGSYIRTGVAEAESGIESGRDRAAARRSSTTVIFPRQDMTHRG